MNRLFAFLAGILFSMAVHSAVSGWDVLALKLGVSSAAVLGLPWLWRWGAR